MFSFIKKKKIAKTLKKFYKVKQPELQNIRVSKVEELSGGIAHDMYSFRLKYTNGVRQYNEEFVIRMYPEDDAVDMCRREFKIMKYLTDTKIPVPYPHFIQLDNELFRMPFLIMDKAKGRTLYQESNSCSEQEAISYFDKFVRLLVMLHSLDISETGLGFMDISTPPYGYVDMCLQELERMLEHVNSEYINYVYEWLIRERNNAGCRHYVFVHGDYHPNNVIVQNDEIVALIDWEGACVGDPVCDLGWTSFLIEVFGNEYELRDSFLEKYQELTNISLRNLKFYEVRGALIFRILSLSTEKYGASEISMQKKAHQLFTDICSLDELDQFIEKRIND